MKISNEDLTQIAYIEAVLGIKFSGSNLHDVVKFIQKNLLNARKAEPSYNDLLQRKWRTFQ